MRKKGANVAAPGVPQRVSHPSAIISQHCLTQKWADVSLLPLATLQQPDTVNSDQKNLLFFANICQTYHRCAFVKTYFMRLPSEFCTESKMVSWARRDRTIHMERARQLLDPVRTTYYSKVLISTY